MSQVQTGNQVHDAAVNKSYGMLQAAVTAAGNNQITINAAYITHYRACLASAIANKCGTEPFLTALNTLGVKA
jgi:3-dehydroquinate dehydratase